MLYTKKGGRPTEITIRKGKKKKKIVKNEVNTNNKNHKYFVTQNPTKRGLNSLNPGTKEVYVKKGTN